MEIGIFAKTFIRPNLEEVLDAVCEHGFKRLQFNMSCAGLPSLPNHIEMATALYIRQQVHSRKLTISAVSGTYNMAHPDEIYRVKGLDRLRSLAIVCKDMGVSIITLCTGSRDRENMWRKHPENSSKEAWKVMTHSMSQAIQVAEEYDVTLAIEPELSNVVDNASRAKILLKEMGSSHLKVVLDAANLYNPGQMKSMNVVMDEAFDLLGEFIVLAHAKDIAYSGESEFVAAGEGMLDYNHYLELLQSIGYEGDLILHGLREDQVAESLRFLRSKLNLL